MGARAAPRHRRAQINRCGAQALTQTTKQKRHETLLRKDTITYNEKELLRGT